MRWTPDFGQGVKLVSIHREDDTDGEYEETVFGGIQGKVALDALKGELTLAQLATKHGASS